MIIHVCSTNILWYHKMLVEQHQCPTETYQVCCNDCLAEDNRKGCKGYRVLHWIGDGRTGRQGRIRDETVKYNGRYFFGGTDQYESTIGGLVDGTGPQRCFATVLPSSHVPRVVSVSRLQLERLTPVLHIDVFVKISALKNTFMFVFLKKANPYKNKSKNLQTRYQGIHTLVVF